MSETTLSKTYNLSTPEEMSMPLVIIRSSESGMSAGLELESGFIGELYPQARKIQFCDSKYAAHYVHPNNVIKEWDVEYTPGFGDGTSHGATWDNFGQTIEDSDYGALRTDPTKREYLLDALTNIAAEGANREGLGWLAIRDSLFVAREIDPDFGYLHSRHYFEGLRLIARYFMELSEARHSQPVL